MAFPVFSERLFGDQALLALVDSAAVETLVDALAAEQRVVAVDIALPRLGVNGAQAVPELPSAGRGFLALGDTGAPLLVARVTAEPQLLGAGLKLDAALLGAGLVQRPAARIGAGAGLGSAGGSSFPMRLAAVGAAGFTRSPCGRADVLAALFALDAVDAATLPGIGNGGANRLVATVTTAPIVVAAGLETLDP